MRKIVLFAAFMMTLQVFGQKNVSADVKSVTVFYSGAQVTREASVDVPAGKSVLKFRGLSPFMDGSTLQVGAEGRLTILSIEHALEEPRKDVAEVSGGLRRKMEYAMERKRVFAAELEVQKGNMEMLKANRVLKGGTENASVEDIKEFSKFYMESQRRVKAMSDSVERMDRLFYAYKKEYDAKVKTGEERVARMAVVTVEVSAKEACRAKFSLTYYVDNAGWTPSYDLRAESIEHKMALVFKAKVMQNTREKWSGVRLTLSASDPVTSKIMPELVPFRLDYGAGAPDYYSNAQFDTKVRGLVTSADDGLPLEGVKVEVGGRECYTGEDGRYEIELPGRRRGYYDMEFSKSRYSSEVVYDVSRNRVNVVLSRKGDYVMDDVVVTEDVVSEKRAFAGSAKVKGIGSVSSSKPEKEYQLFSEQLEVTQRESATAVEYEIANRYSVPSDGKPFTVNVDVYNLETEYQYRCVPVVDPEAFLVARVTDLRKLNLPSADANIYFENTYLGRMHVRTGDEMGMKDEMLIQLGADKNVTVKRTKDEKACESKEVLGKRSELIVYDYEVRNAKSADVKVVVEDQIPVSVNAGIEVSVEEASGAEVNMRNGFVTWELGLATGETRELALRYRVKYSKEN